MSLGILLINITLLSGASRFTTESCNLPLQKDSYQSLQDRTPYSGTVTTSQIPLEQQQTVQLSSASFPEQSSSEAAQAQDASQERPQPRSVRDGSISGTVTDDNADVIPGAEIVLTSVNGNGRQTVIADQNGFFQLREVKSTDLYRLIVSATGFESWTSKVIQLAPGQVLLLDRVALKVDGGPISVTVTASPIEIATEQVRIAEHQRVLGFIPNFLVTYEGNPAPLSAKLKFRLALRVATDPVTFVGVAGLAAIDQAADTPDYVQGLKGYGQRAGALYADGLTDLLLGGAVLPSILHQDPRYFYQGTGTTKSRLLHALRSPFWCRGDNGRWQVNYSSLGGNLASTAISEAYYPSSNRGPGLVFGNFAIGTGERMISGLAQEFLLRKLTRNAAKNSDR